MVDEWVLQDGRVVDVFLSKSGNSASLRALPAVLVWVTSEALPTLPALNDGSSGLSSAAERAAERKCLLARPDGASAFLTCFFTFS